MKICLKTIAKEEHSQHVNLTLHERLPWQVQPPQALACDYRIDDYKDYYLLTMHVKGMLNITCQRCLSPFYHDFSHETQLAVCKNEAQAERLMEQFECVVSNDDQIDLLEVLADDLHLFAPEKHVHLADCDHEMRQWMGEQDEILPTTLGL